MTRALIAIDGSSLTGLSSGFTFPAAPANGPCHRKLFYRNTKWRKHYCNLALFKHSNTTKPHLQIGDSGGMARYWIFWGNDVDVYLNGAHNDAAWKLGSWTGASITLCVKCEIFNDGNKWLLDANAFTVTDTGY